MCFRNFDVILLEKKNLFKCNDLECITNTSKNWSSTIYQSEVLALNIR